MSICGLDRELDDRRLTNKKHSLHVAINSAVNNQRQQHSTTATTQIYFNYYFNKRTFF